MRNTIFELCAETIDACIAAKEGGAHRIELCSGLSDGGLTPSHGLVRSVVECSGLPVHVLLRPRGGGFLYPTLLLVALLQCEDSVGALTYRRGQKGSPRLRWFHRC